ncbi:siderophore biosynthesis protein [Streptomyces subrutilus]|uniref:LLM class flavin-dependent oxidoreductase n=1 Tax=Streptomyces subrutilus TaxID=36818 RepID=A0A5P2UH89_9ACTN|nr:MupA/Atu3671 family FMN-dependent luciferase-like monooxygenase [Streptomyces subrutilus]QEU77835.1 LLM class flavin-dependent oxidoreductase [Streptomyces subrutilus]GGZ62640.1 siderophore biosynthesis protein [Streptomyces subrutilus]
MDFSLFYFANDSTERDANRYELLMEGARFADRNGFSAVWTPERHFHPFGGLYPNPAVTGAAIAAVTERIGIRAGSVVAPLHHPLRIAEEWSVVDNLSGGRVGLSFASGWHATDFALRPENYENRRTILLEQVEQVRALWRGETIPVTDGVGTARELGIYPPPVQPELPVWVTSAGGVETFRNAGRAGAGLLTHLLGQDLDDLAFKISEYRKAIAEQGRTDGWTGQVALMVHTFLGEDEDTVREAVRQPLGDYLRSSLGLLLGSQLDGRRIDASKLAPEDIDFIVARSFDRYFDDGGLLGTVDKARSTVARFEEIGVDEVACLIDFGLPTRSVLESLRHLDTLRELAGRPHVQP